MTSLRDTIKLHEGLVYDRHAYGKGPGWDPELIVEKAAEPSPIEKEGYDLLSDVELEIFYHKMLTIVEEAREVWQNLSISDIILAGDMSTAVFTPSGDLAVASTGIHFHALLNYAQSKFILKYYRDDPTVGLRDGDIFFFNNPLAGSTHAPDMFTAMPVFHEGELVAWAEVGGHQGDCGSVSPGGFNPYATSRFEEGFHMAGVKIGENFRIRKDMLDYLCGSVRNPFVFAVELRSRVATCLRMRDRILREVERRGPAAVSGGLRRLIDLSSELASDRLRQINDGVYRSILFNDTIGAEKGLVRIPVTVVKEGGEMTILVQGVSPPNGKGPVHATWHLVRASQAVYLFAYFFRGLMPNVGLFEPLTFLIEGPSVANSPEDVAHTEGTIISAAVVQSFHIIGSKMLFDSPFRENVSAPFSRNMVALVFYGSNLFGYRATGITSTGNGAGQGARFDGDGEHSTGFYWASMTDAGEVEEFDARYPFTIVARGLLGTDYHGFGMYRGGSALIEVSMAYPNPVVMTSWGTSDVISHNPGLFGGYWGPPNPRLTITKNDALKLMAEGALPELTHHSLAAEQRLDGEYAFESSSVNPKEFEAGDVFLCDTGSGGGYGDVLERDPEAVMMDLREGMISADVVGRVYRVAFDEETLAVDFAATEAQRSEERRARIARGKRFDDFIGGWLAQKPKEHLLTYYGDWPDPRVPGYDKPFWGEHD